MEQLVTLDFETYYSSTYGLTKQTTEEYIRHPEFQVIGVAIKINDEEFKPWLNKYKYHQRHPEQTCEYYQDKCVEILSKYEDILATKLFLFGEKPQVSDVAILPLVRQFAHVDLTFFVKKLPHLNRWLEIWKASMLFQSIMKKYDKWKPGQAPLIVNFNHK